MNINKVEIEFNSLDFKFDFEEWADLYKADPDKFERRRLMWNELIVQSAPEAYQRRLSGLLFQINMEKMRSKNALDSCIRLSELMWNSFNKLKFELSEFTQQQRISKHPDSKEKNKNIDCSLKSAHILDFPFTHKPH